MAHQVVDQGPLFNPNRMGKSSLEAQISFAQMLNKIDTAQVQAKVNIGKYAEGGRLQQAGTQAERSANLARTPEALLPSKVYSKIDKKMDQWAAVYRRQYAPKLKAIAAKFDKQSKGLKGDALTALEAKKNNALAPLQAEAKKAYRNEIGKQMGAAREQIQELYNTHAATPKKLDAELKRIGLTRRDAYYTTHYLKYLENGGPYFSLNPGSGSKIAGDLSEGINNLVHNKSSWNIRTTAYHLFGIAQRAPAAFGFKHTMNGMLDAAAAAKKAGVNLLEQIPALEKQGVYDTDLGPLIPTNHFDPLHAAQTLSDNLGYFIGKRAGDSAKGLKEIAYRPKPWNDTSVFHDPAGKDYLKFMSFQFRHMQQYGGWVKTALRQPGSMTSIKAAKSLVVYSLMSGLIYGDKAAIPAPIYLIAKIADPNFDDDFHGLAGKVPIIGDFANKGIVGSTTGIDLSTEAMPLGGVQVGLGGKMYQTAVTMGPKVPQAMKEMAHGHPARSAALAVDALVTFSQLFKGGANASIQKAVDAATEAYVHDADFPGYFKALKQAFFGKEAVAK